MPRPSPLLHISERLPFCPVPAETRDLSSREDECSAEFLWTEGLQVQLRQETTPNAKILSTYLPTEGQGHPHPLPQRQAVLGFHCCSNYQRTQIYDLTVLDSTKIKVSVGLCSFWRPWVGSVCLAFPVLQAAWIPWAVASPHFDLSLRSHTSFFSL